MQHRAPDTPVPPATSTTSHLTGQNTTQRQSNRDGSASLSLQATMLLPTRKCSYKNISKALCGHSVPTSHRSSTHKLQLRVLHGLLQHLGCSRAANETRLGHHGLTASPNNDNNVLILHHGVFEPGGTYSAADDLEPGSSLPSSPQHPLSPWHGIPYTQP